MFTLSLRARLFLLVALFAVITLALSALSITKLGDLRESMLQGIERWSMSRNLIMHASRDIEAANAEENGMLNASSVEEVTRRVEEQDRLFKAIDDRIAPLDKLLPSDQLVALNRLKAHQEEYRRSDAVLRKLLLDQDTQKARSLYTKEAGPLALKVREVIRRGAEKLDAAKLPKAGAAARDLLSTALAIHAELGVLLVEGGDADIEAGSKRLDALIEQQTTQLDELRDLDPEGQKLAQRAGPLLDDYRKLEAQIVRGARVNTWARAVEIAAKDDALARSTRESVTQLVDKLTAELDSAKKEADELTSRGRSIQLFLSIFGIVGGLLFAGFTVIRIDRGVEAVRGVATEVAGSAGELQLATKAISQRSNEEATSLEETSTTMEEMTAAVEQNRSGAIKARELAEQNREAARQGAEVALKAADAMRSLKDAGTRIADISDTVSELAFQTNILALNAAVEAARAGDHGRGFTVVASEVRTLAQRSGVASREISALIKESLQRIEHGVDLVGKSSQEMTKIMEMSQEVTALVVGISAATQEQAAGITQVSQAVMELNQVVQANSAQAEKMADTAESLDFQSQELVRAVATISGSAVMLPHRKPARDPAAAQARPAIHEGAGNGHKNGASAEITPVGEPIHAAPRENDFRSF